MNERRPFDLPAYLSLVRDRPCFICGLASGDPAFAHPIIHRDDRFIAFLNRFPTLPGYVLVAPLEHREQATGDFELKEYLALQTLIHDIAEALRTVTPTERIYILSLGSQQGNAHVHWHVAALPPDTPFEMQQFAALDAERAGVIDTPAHEAEALAARLAGALPARRPRV